MNITIGNTNFALFVQTSWAARLHTGNGLRATIARSVSLAPFYSFQTLQKEILTKTSVTKQDWARLRKCIAPTLRIDYRSFLNKLWEAMPAEEFVAMVSDPKVLGDPRLMTQHFQGASKWEKVSDDEIIGYHQLRVPHQKYTDETRSAVALKGHAHSSNKRKHPPLVRANRVL